MSPFKAVTNLDIFSSAVNKGRKPKFDLHLKIYDLNNVPLVSGGFLVKWHLAHSIHAEHRGRSSKCPIANHKVDFNYSKAVGHIRINVDKSNNLVECPIEFEVLQEISSGIGGVRDEKIVLGTVKLNLSEYVEESESLGRDPAPARTSRDSGRSEKGHFRKRSSRSAAEALGVGSAGGAESTSASTSSRPSSSSGTPAAEEPDVEEGIIRRYLMQDSKINSTLKIGILMVQVEGEKNFVAPALKTAPVFGGIAGIMSGEQVDQDEAGQLPTMTKSREHAEVQDMYRKSLAASWARQPGELPADQCIEDIFDGGDGWSAPNPTAAAAPQQPQRFPSQASDYSASSGGAGEAGRTYAFAGLGGRAGGGRGGVGFDGAGDTSDEGDVAGDTLRPVDYRRMRHRQHQSSAHGHGHGHGHRTSLMHAFSSSRPRDRHGSNASEMSASTVTGRDGARGGNDSGSGSPFLGYSSASSTPYGPSSSSASRSPSRTGHRREGSGASVGRDDFVGGGGGGIGAGGAVGGLRPGSSSGRSRRGSLASLSPTMGSGSSTAGGAGRSGIGNREGGGYRKAREVQEGEVRDDMVAWRLPGTVT